MIVAFFGAVGSSIDGYVLAKTVVAHLLTKRGRNQNFKSKVHEYSGQNHIYFIY